MDEREAPIRHRFCRFGKQARMEMDVRIWRQQGPHFLKGAVDPVEIGTHDPLAGPERAALLQRVEHVEKMQWRLALGRTNQAGAAAHEHAGLGEFAAEPRGRPYP